MARTKATTASDPLYKVGDILHHRSYREIRVVIGLSEEYVYYVNYALRGEGWFLNPTHSAISHKGMDDKFKVVGQLTPSQLTKLKAAVVKANTTHNEAFRQFMTDMQDPEMDISSFIDRSKIA